MDACNFLIYGIKVSLVTNNVEFQNFILATLQNYKNEKQQDHKFHIEVYIFFNTSSQIEISKFRIGNGVFLDELENKIAIQHKLFLAEFDKLNEQTLRVTGEVNKSIKNTLKQVLKGWAIKHYSYRDMLFHQLYRELILMPVFWVLRHRFGKYLMHGSAVSLGDETFVFLGNDGVGKTTIALKLLQNEGATFFGDNFLLYDSDRIYPFVDTLRVNRNDSKAIKTYNSSCKFKKVHEGKDRIHYNFNKDYISKSASPTHFFVLKQDDISFKSKMTLNQFVNYTLAINDYVKEFDKYSYAGNLIFLFNISFNVGQREVEFLTNLVRGKTCEKLNLSRDGNIFHLFKNVN